MSAPVGDLDGTTGEGATRVVGGRAFAVFGALVVGTAITVAAGLTIAVAFTHTFCTPDEVVAMRDHERHALFAIWGAAAAVPGGIAVTAALWRRRVWPWAAVTAVVLAIAVASGRCAQPSEWCAF